MVDEFQAQWVERVLGFRPPSAGKPDAAAALKRWQQARGPAIGQLRDLCAAVRQGNDPEANAAIILLQAIIKNLTPSPTTPQQVEELHRYISTDDIILEAEGPNGYGLTVALRTPLLGALADMKSAAETRV